MWEPVRDALLASRVYKRSVPRNVLASPFFAAAACYREVLLTVQKHSPGALTCSCAVPAELAQDCKILMKIFSVKVP